MDLPEIRITVTESERREIIFAFDTYCGDHLDLRQLELIGSELVIRSQVAGHTLAFGIGSGIDLHLDNRADGYESSYNLRALRGIASKLTRHGFTDSAFDRRA